MRRGVLALLFVLAGCTGPVSPTSFLVPMPGEGSSAAYVVEGPLIDFWRWQNGMPTAGATRVTITVGEAVTALDGYRVPHDARRVTIASEGGAARELFVDRDHNAIVQSSVRINNAENVVAFDERGYPWAFGASLFMGRNVENVGTLSFDLPGNGGEAPRSLAWTTLAHDGARATVALSGSEARWELDLEAGSPWPREVRVSLDAGSLAPNVRLLANATVEMRARLVEADPGVRAIPFGDRDASWNGGEAERVDWNERHPPDGTQAYAPFLLTEAVAFAEASDPPTAEFLRANPTSIVSRASYFAAPGLLPQTTAHSWLLQYAAESGRYHETRVNRTVTEPTGVPLLTRVEASGEVPAPRGEHGWFDTSRLPKDLVTIGAAVGIVKEVFGAPNVQIFVRSFTEPIGYGYYVDGGFEAPQGRYTVIVNAQSGFVQAAVGPVTPRLVK